MNTPIYDFARKYAESDAIRMHMPGHKGKPILGCEPLDLTEISGADELFAPDGIIAESERNASAVFGCRTLYSTEGSSLCIRAMLYLILQYAAETGRKPVIAAGRNVHKTFLTAAALLRFEIIWLEPASAVSYLHGGISEDALQPISDAPDPPVAVWLTSPDYLGSLANIRLVAGYCHTHNMLLAVDGAHGAYLRFLKQSLHPIDLGADLCCTSAHKTLPVLTGGAYLHLAARAPEYLHQNAKSAMAMFATTSPSYLILESLDLCNHYLDTDFAADLSSCTSQVHTISKVLAIRGWKVCGDEPMKLTLRTKPYGYTGTEVAQILREENILVEFADPDYVVLMPSPQNESTEISSLCITLYDIPQREALTDKPPAIPKEHAQTMPLSEVLSARTETLPAAQCIGRICAEFSVSCPPAVPIVICGERITEEAIRCMDYYGVNTCRVVKE